MNIGSLFLSMGIKGTEKTVDSLGNVKKGLADTASMSLEAKAAIIGSMYALEQLFATSGRAGTELTNFNALTGESVQTLQRYQYAGRQVGISNEETANSFKTLQSAMSKTLLGEGGPKGLARVAMLTGSISQKDIQDYMKNPELLLQRLEQYAAKEKNIGLRNETLKTFGLGDNVIAGLSRNAFRPEVLNKAPTYSDKEVAQLDKANIAWSNLGNKIQMAIGHFNALHGNQLVGDISKIVDQVVKLAGAFTTLADKLHLFQGIGKVFEGWTDIFKSITGGVDAVTKTIGHPKQEKELLLNGLEGGKNVVVGMLEDLKDKLFGSSDIAPAVGKQLPAQNSQNHAITINNQFQHPGVDPHATGHSIKQAVNQAMRQSYTQTQST